MAQEQKKIRRTFKGEVVSAKMNKTVVVRVDRVSIHPKYGKRFTMSKKYKAHNENATIKEGDVVTIEECRPISKDKKWRVISQVDSTSK